MSAKDELDPRRRAPREPMEGGSDGGDLGDDALAAVGSGLCDGCDSPDCNGCDLLRLSLILTVAATLVPNRADRPVLVLLRFYRRLLTRFTPACPSTPSCSAYALSAIETLGPRRGLAAAAHRVRTCGRMVCTIQDQLGSV